MENIDEDDTDLKAEPSSLHHREDSMSESELELFRNPDKDRIKKVLDDIKNDAKHVLTQMANAEFMSSDYQGFHKLL
jgi:hypothetical protein